MARRRDWSDLSAAYRRRLERGGITRNAYERGVPLRSARGHGQTPEHPREAERHPERYQRYRERRRPAGPTRRQRALQALNDKVARTYRDRPAYKRPHVYDPPFPIDDFTDEELEEMLTWNPAQMETMQTLAANSFISNQDPEWLKYAFLWYH